MSNGLLLWIDDEIELLKAHIIFLEKKGYEVATVSNGSDAIELCRQQTFDLILLDEMMPGLSGLETLQQIKDIQPATPVVMCTKSEEENIMDQAIGSKIADYLIKPVNPSQILLSLKKNIHRKDIVTEVTQSGYQQDYQQIALKMMDCRTCHDWMEIYRRLVKWELELSDTDSQMTEMLVMQKEEANTGFAKFIAKNYLDWVDQKRDGNAGKAAAASSSDDRPMMSPDVFKNRIFPILDKGEKVVVVEDLISTGGSVLDAVDALREAGAEVLGVVSIFTYGMKKGVERLAAAQVRNVSLTDLDTVASTGAQEGYITEADVARLLAFRENPSDESWIRAESQV